MCVYILIVNLDKIQLDFKDLKHYDTRDKKRNVGSIRIGYFYGCVCIDY